MQAQEFVSGQCPYCGETIELLVDCHALDQQYTEDCQVCCQPIIVQPQCDNQGQIIVQLWREAD